MHACLPITTAKRSRREKLAARAGTCHSRTTQPGNAIVPWPWRPCSASAICVLQLRSAHGFDKSNIGKFLRMAGHALTPHLPLCGGEQSTRLVCDPSAIFINDACLETPAAGASLEMFSTSQAIGIGHSSFGASFEMPLTFAANYTELSR